MTLPYLPGWWDEISKSATGFAAQLPQILQPDSVANKRLQDMVQQNPMLLTQIENMTPEARMAMEQTLGFKKQTPLQKLPVGAQLKQQMEDAKYLESLTPEQREIRQAARVGTLSLPELKRKQTEESQKDQKFQQDLMNGNLQNQILTGQAKDVERVGAQIDDAIAKYPSLKGIDLKKIVSSALRGGTPIDPQLMTRIQSDPGAKQLFDITYTAELAKFKNELDTRLARTRNAQDETLLVRTLAEIGNQLDDQEGRVLAEMNSVLRSFEEEMSKPQNIIIGLNSPSVIENKKRELLKPYEDRIAQIRRAASENTARTTSLVEKMGIKTPASSTVPPPTGPVGPLRQETEAERIERLRKIALGIS